MRFKQWLQLQERGARTGQSPNYPASYHDIRTKPPQVWTTHSATGALNVQLTGQNNGPTEVGKDGAPRIVPKKDNPYKSFYKTEANVEAPPGGFRRGGVYQQHPQQPMAANTAGANVEAPVGGFRNPATGGNSQEMFVQAFKQTMGQHLQQAKQMGISIRAHDEQGNFSVGVGRSVKHFNPNQGQQAAQFALQLLQNHLRGQSAMGGGGGMGAGYFG